MNKVGDSHPYPIGARIEKINSVADDTHADGARATVIKVTPVGDQFAYVLVWDDLPELQVVIASTRVRLCAPDVPILNDSPIAPLLVNAYCTGCGAQWRSTITNYSNVHCPECGAVAIQPK